MADVDFEESDISDLEASLEILIFNIFFIVGRLSKSSSNVISIKGVLSSSELNFSFAVAVFLQTKV